MRKGRTATGVLARGATRSASTPIKLTIEEFQGRTLCWSDSVEKQKTKCEGYAKGTDCGYCQHQREAEDYYECMHPLRKTAQRVEDEDDEE